MSIRPTLSIDVFQQSVVLWRLKTSGWGTSKKLTTDEKNLVLKPEYQQFVKKSDKELINSVRVKPLIDIVNQVRSYLERTMFKIPLLSGVYVIPVALETSVRAVVIPLIEEYNRAKQVLAERWTQGWYTDETEVVPVVDDFGSPILDEEGAPTVQEIVTSKWHPSIMEEAAQLLGPIFDSGDYPESPESYYTLTITPFNITGTADSPLTEVLEEFRHATTETMQERLMELLNGAVNGLHVEINDDGIVERRGRLPSDLFQRFNEFVTVVRSLSAELHDAESVNAVIDRIDNLIRLPDGSLQDPEVLRKNAGMDQRMDLEDSFADLHREASEILASAPKRRIRYNGDE